MNRRTAPVKCPGENRKVMKLSSKKSSSCESWLPESEGINSEVADGVELEKYSRSSNVVSVDLSLPWLLYTDW